MSGIRHVEIDQIALSIFRYFYEHSLDEITVWINECQTVAGVQIMLDQRL